MYSSKRHVVLVLAVLTKLCGCASQPKWDYSIYPSTEEIYEEVNHGGQVDTISALRESIYLSNFQGSPSNAIPIRRPERIIKVWNVPYPDERTGIWREAHWEMQVLEEARWQ